MQETYKTERLFLNKLSSQDVDLIFELLNTAGWKKFIGDRNINSPEDAVNYIQKINSAPGITYWAVTLQEQQIPLGLVTLIKRDYLEHNDIGFAFLPQHAKQGYAFEAASAVLHELLHSGEHATILATTLTNNVSSIQLLTKLGLVFEKEISVGNEKLQLYAIHKKKTVIPV